MFFVHATLLSSMVRNFKPDWSCIGQECLIGIIREVCYFLYYFCYITSSLFSFLIALTSLYLCAIFYIYFSLPKWALSKLLSNKSLRYNQIRAHNEIFIQDARVYFINAVSTPHNFPAIGYFALTCVD